MKQTKRRIKKAAAVLAFLAAVAVSVTYCRALYCYSEDTATTCVASGTGVDTVTLCEAPSSTGCGSYLPATLYADSTWYKHPHVYIDGGTYPASATHACGGPAHFTNPLNGQSSATELIDYWQNGLMDPTTYGFPWTKRYDGVDYNSSPINCEY